MNADEQEMLVVSFFQSAAGELCCSVRDARTQERWLLKNPQELQRVLAIECPGVKLAKRDHRH